MDWWREYKKLGKGLFSSTLIEMIGLYCKVSLFRKLIRTKSTLLNISHMMTTMLAKCWYKKCQDSSRRASKRQPRSKLQKSVSTMSEKKSLWPITWTMVKFNQSKSNILVIRFSDMVKLIRMKKKLMTLSCSNSIRSFPKWKNKLINQSDKFKLLLQNNTKASEMVF